MMHLFGRLLMAVFAAAVLTAAILLPQLPTRALVPLLLIEVVLLVLLARLISRQTTASLAEYGRLVKALARGERGRRTRVPETSELSELGSALNILAETLDQEIAPLRAEQSQTAEILSAMSDGVLLVDAGGRVLRTNPAASHMLNVPAEELEGQSIAHAARTFPAVSLIEQALRAQRPGDAHVEMPGGRQLHVQTIPLRAEIDPALRGGLPDHLVLLIMRDETDRVRTDRMRRDFAANVSHELKTPLAGITLLADTLQHAVDDDPEQARRFARRLSTEIDHLTDLVTDLLTLSRLEEGTPSDVADINTIDLREVARSAAAEVADRARTAGVSVEVEAPRTVLVRGNRVDLETMTRNLLDNAVRFTDSGGHVWVTLDATPTEAVLAVRDDGVGIPRDDQARIFERFYRVDRARSRETGGTGLGLSIVRHVAEGHGGGVRLESTVGVGSTFTVHLPLAGGPAPADVETGGRTSGTSMADTTAAKRVPALTPTGLGTSQSPGDGDAAAFQ